MGMSASQARYLQLTARKSDLEYEAQQICQRRLELADKTNGIATTYNQQISDRRMYYVPVGTTSFGSTASGLNRLTYSDITSSLADGGMGLKVTNSEGKIISLGIPDEIPDGLSEEDYLIDLSCLSADILEDKLRSGEWFISKFDTDNMAEEGTSQWDTVNWSTSSSVYDTLYTENDNSAEAEYTEASARIQRQDKILELRLNQITTQQKAIDTELDSVKKVLDKNVETTFKTFG